MYYFSSYKKQQQTTLLNQEVIITIEQEDFIFTSIIYPFSSKHPLQLSNPDQFIPNHQHSSNKEIIMGGIFNPSEYDTMK